MKNASHTLKPIFNNNSKILILGSFPSVKSRELCFYYSHPQNRFWKIISLLLGEDEPSNNYEKEQFLIRHNIALWDVIKSCDIEGSSDSSIKNVIPNDINYILRNSKVKTIFTTGKKASQLYKKYCYQDTRIENICLPSTSPANCKLKINDLVKEYNVILKYIKS